MELIVSPKGQIRCLYDETIPLAALGSLFIQRASHVEPDDTGKWHADLSPVSGPILGPYSHRSEALAAEVEWIQAHLFSSKTLF